MAHKTFEINTIEDLVKFADENPCYVNTKWELNDSVDWAWADEDAGLAWEKEVSDFRDTHIWRYSMMTPEERAAYNAAEEAIYARKPKMKKNVAWSLNAKGKSWGSSTTLVLAQEVGHALDSIWTKKAAYRGAPYKVRANNGLTINGMLKRLEQSDIKAAVVDAKERVEVERRKNERNATRRRVSALAKEIRRIEGEIARIKSENPHINWPDSLEGMINIELEA